MNTTPTEADLRAILDAMPSADDDTLTRLHFDLEWSAQRDDLLDVAYTTLDTPVGTLLLAATDRGLVRVAYDREDHDAVLEVCRSGSARASCGPLAD